MSGRRGSRRRRVSLSPAKAKASSGEEDGSGEEHEVGGGEERTLRERGEEEEREHARSSRGGFKSQRLEAGGGRGTPAVSRDWKGKKDIVLPRTHVSDPLNGRKRME